MRTAIDTLYLHDPQFTSNAEAFRDDVGGTCAIHPVSCLETLRAALAQYVQVKFLVLDTHGRPGALSMADGGTIDGMDFQFLHLLPPDLLKKQARVLFYGCNLGAGPEGDRFLDEFGLAAFRGKGGTAGASTVSNFSILLGRFGSANAWMDLASPVAARLKVVRYNEAGHRMAGMSVNRWGTPD
jgi:hypothetical protein